MKAISGKLDLGAASRLGALTRNSADLIFMKETGVTKKLTVDEAEREHRRRDFDNWQCGMLAEQTSTNCRGLEGWRGIGSPAGGSDQ